MLLGREEERLAIDRLLAEAREGRSGVLALVGEPGIGKTALLEHAVAEAGEMRVLAARGIESEAAVPFAVLSELLRPALGAIDRIPAPQAAALAGALALAPATAQGRFATGAAALSLLSAYADDGPLLLVVDDAHLLDASSAEALLFAARRLVADPIAVLIAVREGEPSLLDGADLPTLRLGGLGEAETAALLELASDAGDVRRLHAATAGNPLALLELASDAGELALAPEGAPVLLSARLSRRFLRRAEGLGDDVRAALVLAATSDSSDPAVLTPAAGRLG